MNPLPPSTLPKDAATRRLAARMRQPSPRPDPTPATEPISSAQVDWEVLMRPV
ncbi:MAG: hypothetical protein AAFQ61_05560 [Cyanobacteria bacterium J06626_23]